MAALFATLMLQIKRPLLEKMLDHLQACYPLEGCGLLAGDAQGRVTAVYPIENSLHSPTTYEMEPHQQIEAMLALEAAGWQLLAIYHSHPQGPEQPSTTDIAQAYYPEALHIIVSLREQTVPVVRAFQILGQEVIEQKIKTKLLIRGFSKDTLLNNRGLIGATTDETILEVVKNLGIANVSNQRELLLAFAGWLYGNLDKEVEQRIVDDYLNSK